MDSVYGPLGTAGLPIVGLWGKDLHRVLSNLAAAPKQVRRASGSAFVLANSSLCREVLAEVEVVRAVLGAQPSLSPCPADSSVEVSAILVAPGRVREGTAGIGHSESTLSNH